MQVLLRVSGESFLSVCHSGV